MQVATLAGVVHPLPGDARGVGLTRHLHRTAYPSWAPCSRILLASTQQAVPTVHTLYRATRRASDKRSMTNIASLPAGQAVYKIEWAQPTRVTSAFHQLDALIGAKIGHTNKKGKGQKSGHLALVSASADANHAGDIGVGPTSRGATNIYYQQGKLARPGSFPCSPRTRPRSLSAC